MRENWSKNWSQITKLHLWWRRLGEVCLEDRHSEFRSLLIKFISSLVGLLGAVMSGIGHPASDASRISLLNMREPMDLQTTTSVKRSRTSAWKTDIQSSVVCRKISKLCVGLLDSVKSGIGWPPLITAQFIEHEKKLNRNHRSSWWSSTTPTVCEEVLGSHSKFSLLACCHLCGMTRLPGSYCGAMYSFFAYIISEFLLSFKARCMLLSLYAVGFTNTKMVGSDMAVGCHESLSYLSWFCSN